MTSWIKLLRVKELTRRILVALGAVRVTPLVGSCQYVALQKCHGAMPSLHLGAQYVNSSGDGFCFILSARLVLQLPEASAKRAARRGPSLLRLQVPNGRVRHGFCAI